VEHSFRGGLQQLTDSNTTSWTYRFPADQEEVIVSLVYGDCGVDNCRDKTGSTGLYVAKRVENV
jgi:hypothetical protein